MSDPVVELIHRRVFTLRQRPVCETCRVSWPCLVAKERAASAKLIADPWWYVKPRQPPERVKVE